MNGPKIPIAKREFINLQNLKLTNLDSVLPGFDLASAYLNEESIAKLKELKSVLSQAEEINISMTDVVMFAQFVDVARELKIDLNV